MTVPTNPKLRQVAGVVDKVANFGAWPPAVAYKDTFNGEGMLLNLQEQQNPVWFAMQIAGIRSHGLWAGVWHPVPAAGDDGAARAKWIHDRIAAIDAELVKLSNSPDPLAPFAKQGKVDIVWLNLEGYTSSQWREFLWGRPSALPGPQVRGWRGSAGAFGSTGGYRNGISTGVVDEPFKDGTVKPHADLMAARVMLAVEGFYGPTSQWVDMTPADHVQAIVDRLRGFRSDGTFHDDEAWPFDQVVGCYDAALGTIVNPDEPLLIRSGLHFTLDRARGFQLL